MPSLFYLVIGTVGVDLHTHGNRYRLPFLGLNCHCHCNTLSISPSLSPCEFFFIDVCISLSK